MLNTSPESVIADYYARRETRWGYKLLLGGYKNYGYSPKGEHLSLRKALKLMSHEVGKELGLDPGARVLDAGCGEGPVALDIAEEFGYKIIGIDLLQSSIDIATRNKQRRNLSKELWPAFKVMDYTQTDFPDNYFDGIYVLEALVHSPDYRQTLKEFYRILKPGGVLVNHDYVLPEKMSPRDYKAFRIIYDGSGMNTLDEFHPNKMKKSWEEAGFRNVSIYNGIEEITPMMKKLHIIGYIPFHILKLVGREEKYVNTYAGVLVYRLRHLIRYNMMRSYKITG